MSTALYVALGRSQSTDGPCDRRHAATGLYALAPNGPVVLGVFDWCDDECGEWWFCATCPRVLPGDGDTVFAHLRDRHQRLLVAG